MGAAARRVLVFGLLCFLCGVTARAQDSAVPPAQPNEHVAADTVKFLGGGVLALALHESGHLVFDAVFDAQPRLEGIRFGPFPFFAVTHRSGMPPREEFTISSAGFWAQEATDEWLLSRKADQSWLTKGMFAFNVLNAVGYGFVAFARAGPAERDTRGMSTIGIDERVIGLVVLAPAVLDAYRYFRPDSRAAAWLSRGAKIGSVLLVVR